MEQKQIQVKVEDELIKGRYTNNMQITHTKEEFVMDFFSIFPPAGIMVSRVITNPGHYKRIIKAMRSNLEMYEKKFGKISEADEPSERKIGFKTD